MGCRVTARVRLGAGARDAAAQLPVSISVMRMPTPHEVVCRPRPIGTLSSTLPPGRILFIVIALDGALPVRQQAGSELCASVAHACCRCGTSAQHRDLIEIQGTSRLLPAPSGWRGTGQQGRGERGEREKRGKAAPRHLQAPC